MRLVSRDENDVYEIGNKIREAREAQGMSQDDLADVMGTSRKAVSRHEIGQAEMGVTTFVQYMDALKAEADQLLPGRLQKSRTRSERLKEIAEQLNDTDQELLLMMAERLKRDEK